ncbi:hypothetical protein POM88_043975 [Heracleum sosnowskyi]|uniref:Cytochrome P450 n=1 Tax=Heracleum sosnowskyi TaxID=360622 RepID=A0AAD8H4K2_9APIA|nr:hypothetical protein POM88_043975 [Heracleum sosnowskyi]
MHVPQDYQLSKSLKQSKFEQNGLDDHCIISDSCFYYIQDSVFIFKQRQKTSTRTIPVTHIIGNLTKIGKLPHQSRACPNLRSNHASKTRKHNYDSHFFIDYSSRSPSEARPCFFNRKVNELIGYVKKCSQTGEAIDIGRAAFRTSLNLLSNTIFSKDMANPYEDSAKEFRDLVWGIMCEIGKPNVSDFFLVLKKLDPQGVKRRITRHFTYLLKILECIFVENTNALDELIKVCQENPDYEIDMTQMAHLRELLKSTKTMVKAKAEISQVPGQSKMLEEADIHQLPYLRCIVKETLRFLDSEIDVKGQDFELIPFGTGRRICPGLPLVMRMVSAMLGSLLNCFNWELEGGIAPNELDMVENFGITVEKLYPLRALATSVLGLAI